MNVYYSAAYAGSEYAFETTRKSRWIAESLEINPISGVKLVAPDPLSFEQISSVHDESYVRAVETGEPRDLAQTQGFDWDLGFWEMARTSNGGVVAAALDAMKNGVSGSLSSGLHHARRDSGSGYCTFNGLVIAAKAAIDAGARSVLIVDLDAHCGGRTYSLIADDERLMQLDVSVSSFEPPRH
jgi:acetoin utilization deacetylase AcuC-like enzyme